MMQIQLMYPLGIELVTSPSTTTFMVRVDAIWSKDHWQKQLKFTLLNYKRNSKKLRILTTLLDQMNPTPLHGTFHLDFFHQERLTGKEIAQMVSLF